MGLHPRAARQQRQGLRCGPCLRVVEIVLSIFGEQIT